MKKIYYKVSLQPENLFLIDYAFAIKGGVHACEYQTDDPEEILNIEETITGLHPELKGITLIACPSSSFSAAAYALFNI